MNKIILVALDASEAATHVLSAALQQAQVFDARVLLLHAVRIPTELAPEAMLASPDEVLKILERRAERELEEHAKRVPPSALEGRVVEFGTPWRTICEIAKARDVALIVMGAHGHRWSDGLLGTNAARVVSHADRSVLVVRDPRAAAPREVTPDAPERGSLRSEFLL